MTTTRRRARSEITPQDANTDDSARRVRRHVEDPSAATPTLTRRRSVRFEGDDDDAIAAPDNAPSRGESGAAQSFHTAAASEAPLTLEQAASRAQLAPVRTGRSPRLSGTPLARSYSTPTHESPAVARGNLRFDLYPRFYIPCLFSDGMAEVEAEMRRQLHLAGVPFESVELVLDFELQPVSSSALSTHVAGELEPEHTQLGSMLINIVPYKLATDPACRYMKMSDCSKAIYDISSKVKKIVGAINAMDKMKPHCHMANDEPYLGTLSKAHNLTPEDTPAGAWGVVGDEEYMAWEEGTLRWFQEDIARWVEFYTGQHPDYFEHVFSSKVEHNISNRKSEFHFIGRNSCFAFLPENTPPANKYSYMDEHFFGLISQFKELVWMYRHLNSKLDDCFTKVNELEREHLLQNTPLSMQLLTIGLEREIEKLRFVENHVHVIYHALLKQKMFQRRPHSLEVMRKCIAMDDMEMIKDEIFKKIDTMHGRLEHMYNRNSRIVAERTERRIQTLSVIESFNCIAGILIIEKRMGIFELMEKLINCQMTPFQATSMAYGLILAMFACYKSYKRLEEASTIRQQTNFAAALAPDTPVPAAAADGTGVSSTVAGLPEGGAAEAADASPASTGASPRSSVPGSVPGSPPALGLSRSYSNAMRLQRAETITRAFNWLTGGTDDRAASL